MNVPLTTSEAAELAAVTPSTIKRWADQGRLPVSRTVGGHRRFERAALERLLRASAGSAAPLDPVVAGWIRCLVEGRRHEIDGLLLEARFRLGAWCRVSDELGGALVELGAQWAGGGLGIAEEHMASEALGRALARMGEALPAPLTGRRCVLACALDDEHTLGLSMAELCLRELGWASVWLGRRTPVAELERLLAGGRVALVALSASAACGDGKALGRLARVLGVACRERGVGLVLGGAGAWPARPPHGVRLTSFAAFHDYLDAAAQPR